MTPIAARIIRWRARLRLAKKREKVAAKLWSRAIKDRERCETALRVALRAQQSSC